MEWTIEIREVRSGLAVVEADTSDEAIERFETYHAHADIEWDVGHDEPEILSVYEREE